MQNSCVLCEKYKPTEAYSTWATAAKFRPSLANIDIYRREALHLHDMAKVCSGCVEAVSCFGEHVVTRDYEYKSQVCRNQPSATRVHKRLGELRRNVFAMSAQFDEDEMHVHEQLDASFNAPKERRLPTFFYI